MGKRWLGNANADRLTLTRQGHVWLVVAARHAPRPASRLQFVLIGQLCFH